MITKFVAAILEPHRNEGGPRGYVGRHRAPQERYVATVRIPVPARLSRPAAVGRG